MVNESDVNKDREKGTRDYPKDFNRMFREELAELAKRRSKNKFLATREEWQNRGLGILRRRILGICREERVFSIDRLADIFVSLELADNRDEGRKMVEGVCNYHDPVSHLVPPNLFDDETMGRIYYYTDFMGESYLQFTRRTLYNPAGQEVCDVLVHRRDPNPP